VHGLLIPSVSTESPLSLSPSFSGTFARSLRSAIESRTCRIRRIARRKSELRAPLAADADERGEGSGGDPRRRSSSDEVGKFGNCTPPASIRFVFRPWDLYARLGESAEFYLLVATTRRDRFSRVFHRRPRDTARYVNRKSPFTSGRRV
jgi:hypothetical protein